MRRGSGDLLARFRAGDEAAFTELVNDIGPRLLGYFLRQGAQPAAAEDLSQQVFLRVLQNLERYRERGTLEAYFLRIARNLWIDHRRRLRPVGGAPERLQPADPGPGPQEQAASRDRATRIRAVLGDLDEPTRELLELAVLQRLPYQEVGAILGIPVGTVKSRVFYSLRRLRSRLEGTDLEGEPGG